MLITFCLFSEYARNSSIFDLNGVYSVSNTLSPTDVPARLRCVISLVDYILLCVVKSLFICVLIFFSCAIFHIFYSCIQMFTFFVHFSITKLYSSLLFFKIYSKNHYLLYCRIAFISMCCYPEQFSIHMGKQSKLSHICYKLLYNNNFLRDGFSLWIKNIQNILSIKEWFIIYMVIAELYIRKMVEQCC